MIPLQFVGGPEMMVIFLLFSLVFSVVPLILAVAVTYWLYKIRTDVAAIRRTVESGEAGRTGTEGVGAAPEGDET